MPEDSRSLPPTRSGATLSQIVTRRRFLTGAAAAAAGAALAACAPAQAPVPTAAPKAAPPTAAPTAEAKAPPKPKQLVKLKLVQSSPGLSFAPVYLAREAGYFADEGIELEWQQVQGGALATTALINGESQLMATASSDNLQGYEKKLDILGIAGITTSLTMNWAASKTFAQKKGLTRQSPIKDRIAALKGAKIGVATVSGAPTQFAKYMLKVNGMDPETAAEYVVVGGGATRVAALQQDKIDVFIGGIPDAEVTEDEGFGIVYIVMAEEVPVFKDFMYEVLSAKKDWAEKNPELAQRAVRAIGRANNHILSDFEDSKKILKKALPDIKPAVVDLAMNNAKTAFGPDARMSEVLWKNAVDVFTTAGTIKTAVPASEGAVWTNKYLVDVPKR